MTRHDPLSALSPEADLARVPAQAKPKKTRDSRPKTQDSRLLRELADVPDGTLAFLDANSEPVLHRPAEEIRAEFTAFCADRSFANWRQAWAAYRSNLKLHAQSLCTVPVQFGRTVEKPVAIEQRPQHVQTPAPVLPLNLQRVRERARLFASLHR